MHGFQGGGFHRLEVAEGLPPLVTAQAVAVEQEEERGIVEAGATIDANAPLGIELEQDAGGLPVFRPDFDGFGEVFRGQPEVGQFGFGGQPGVIGLGCLRQFFTRPSVMAV